MKLMLTAIKRVIRIVQSAGTQSERQYIYHLHRKIMMTTTNALNVKMNTEAR